MFDDPRAAAGLRRADLEVNPNAIELARERIGGQNEAIDLHGQRGRLSRSLQRRDRQPELKLTTLASRLVASGVAIALGVLVPAYVVGADDIVPGSACPTSDDPPAPTAILFQGRIVEGGLAQRPMPVIPVDVDAHFVLAVEVDNAEGCIPGGLPRRTNFLIHSPALFFGFQLGRLPRESGAAVEGTYSFRLEAKPLAADRWTFDLGIRDLGPAAVGILSCTSEGCFLESDRALTAGTRLVALDGQGGARLIEVGGVVAREPGAPAVLIDSAPARFAYRATSDETGDYGPAAVFRFWARVPDSEGLGVAWDWPEPPERLTRSLSREGIHFAVERTGDGAPEELWRGYYYLGYDVEPTCP